MSATSHVPPGFRFHPTDEELVDYYLRNKVSSSRIGLDVIKEVDLYNIEPWDLQGTEMQNEWYFFSYKDKKYPTGTRTNRATQAGFWKATGRDKAIYAKRNDLIGMRKTLVFYKSRAPNGLRSDWIMHEYCLKTNENSTSKEEGWVVCRVFKKKIPTINKVNELESECNWYDDSLVFIQEFEDSPLQNPNPNNLPYHNISYTCKKEIDLQYQHVPFDDFLQLTLLQSPSKQINNALHSNINTFSSTTSASSLTQEQNLQSMYANNNEQGVDQILMDWRVLDKFVASQLSQDDHHGSKESSNNYSSPNMKRELLPKNASTSTMSLELPH